MLFAPRATARGSEEVKPGTSSQPEVEMKFFLDTANIEDIRRLVPLGIVDGVTTNPSLVAKEGRIFEEVVLEICEIVDGPVSAEVVSTEAEAMVAEAEPLAKIHPNVVIKVPMIPEGLKATHQLRKRGIRVNQTLIFSASQALLAAKAGASFVSPFIGRLDDVSHTGLEIISDIVEIFGHYAFDCEILVASTRSVLHVLESARMGADICTMPPKVMDQMMKHPLTDIGLEKFLADWEKVPK
jgi:transaldolase